VFFRKDDKPTSFDFTAAINQAISHGMQVGMNRRTIIEKLEQIVESQERYAAVTYRSSYLPPAY
jgi:hypothetical protein